MQKPLCYSQIAISAEHELDCIAVAIDGTVQIKPPTFDLDISLVQIPFSSDFAFLPIEARKQHGVEVQNPAMHRRMIHGNAALGHHFLQIAKAQIGSQAPSNTKENDGLIEGATFEHQIIQLLKAGNLSQRLLTKRLQQARSTEVKISPQNRARLVPVFASHSRFDLLEQ